RKTAKQKAVIPALNWFQNQPLIRLKGKIMSGIFAAMSAMLNGKNKPKNGLMKIKMADDGFDAAM
ncbi:hypothetical protein Lisr_2707, partial [Legionella israelensis]